MEQFSALAHNPGFWVGVAFVIFVGGVYKIIARFMGDALDKRAATIAEELEHATALREEAQIVLAQYQKKQRESLEEAEEIIRKANQEARRITKEAETELEENLKKRMKLATDKIEQAERHALADVQNHLVEITVTAARSIIQESATADTQDAMMRAALQDMQKKLH